MNVDYYAATTYYYAATTYTYLGLPADPLVASHEDPAPLGDLRDPDRVLGVRGVRRERFAQVLDVLPERPKPVDQTPSGPGHDGRPGHSFGLTLGISSWTTWWLGMELFLFSGLQLT